MSTSGVPVRNLADIARQDSNLGLAIQDLIAQIGSLKSQVSTLQSQVAALNKKVGL